MSDPEKLDTHNSPQALAHEAARLAVGALRQASDSVVREEVLDELKGLVDEGVFLSDVRAHEDEVAPTRTGVVTGRTREAVMADRQAPLTVRRQRARNALRLAQD